MKPKIILIIALIAFVATSCKTASHCDAYGSTKDAKPIETT